ncbi:MAG: hypothetical protein K0R55_3988 [Sporomusa sp.]|jgi:hypothetical protein|nr:hypothetical protein [Sporomusa sp.]
MATVGQSLTAPESGWQRYNDRGYLDAYGSILRNMAK